MFHLHTNITQKYFDLYTKVLSSLFEEEDIDEVMKLISHALGLEVVVIGSCEENKIHFDYSNYGYLSDIEGYNPLLFRHIQDEESFEVTQLQDILTGIIDTNTIENIQYSKRIHTSLIIAKYKYFILVSSRKDFSSEEKNFLSVVIGLYYTYAKQILSVKKELESLHTANKSLQLIHDLSNYTFVHPEEETLAKYFTDTCSLAMHYKAVCLTLLKKGEWEAISASSDSHLSGLLSHGFIGKRMKTSSVIELLLNNPILQNIPVVDVFEPSIAMYIKEHLAIEKVIVIPILSNKTVIGYLSIVASKKSLPYVEEKVLKEFGKELGNLFSFANDFSNIKKEKEALEIAYKRIQEINREKDNLISIASHELRTPATIARDAIDLIQEYNSLHDPKIIEKLYMIKEATGRELSIITTLLEVSRINAKKMELVYQKDNIEELISLAIEEMQLEAQKKGLTINYNKKVTPLPEIFMDKTRIREVIDNLLTNAIKYTDQGSITITTEAKNGFVYISVEDTGKGISSEVQKTLFQMFHRITQTSENPQDSHQGGLGLGLYIVKNILDAHNATISVESDVGKGTTFLIRLPITSS